MVLGNKKKKRSVLEFQSHSSISSLKSYQAVYFASHIKNYEALKSLQTYSFLFIPCSKHS